MTCTSRPGAPPAHEINAGFCKSAGAGREIRASLQLRHHDMDSLGHLNHSVYHVFFSEARIALLDAAGLDDPYSFVLAHMECDHEHEVRIRDRRLDVVCGVIALGTSSVRLLHELWIPGGGRAAHAEGVLVCWDVERRRSRRLSDFERAALWPSAKSEADAGGTALI